MTVERHIEWDTFTFIQNRMGTDAGLGSGSLLVLFHLLLPIHVVHILQSAGPRVSGSEAQSSGQALGRIAGTSENRLAMGIVTSFACTCKKKKTSQ